MDKTDNKYESIILEFSKMGIHDLRNIARSYKVVAPTLMKREELLEGIANKILGREDNREKKLSKRGRPPKNKFISNLKIEVPHDILSLDNVSFSTDCFQSLPEFEATLIVNEPKNAKSFIAEGYLQILNDNGSHYFFAVDKETKKFAGTIVVPSVFIKEFALLPGDKIKATAIESTQASIFILTSIIEVNNSEPMMTAQRIYHGFEDGKIPDEEIITDFISFKAGERVLLNNHHPNIQLMKKISNFIAVLDEKNKKVVFLGVDLPQEVFSVFKLNKSAESFITEYGETLSYSCNMILSAYDHSLSCLADGKNVVFIIYDIYDITKVLNSKINKFRQENVDGFSENSVTLAKKFFSCAKATANNDGSITTVIITQNNDFKSPLIQNNFIKNASKIIEIK